MNKSVTPLLATLVATLVACQPLTDPCYQLLEDAPSRCAGEIVVDASDAQAPVFSVENAGPVTPNYVSVTELDADPCSGGVRLWEVKGFEPEELPLAYGDRTSGRTWVNEVLSPDGTLIPLREGRLYEVSLLAKDRLDDSGAAPTTWSAVFEPGQPDSVMLSNDFCALAE